MNTFDTTSQKLPLGCGVSQQTANSILMIEPVAFGFNDQTAVNNYFQQKNSFLKFDIQQLALSEFKEMVAILRAYGVNVVVVKDTEHPHTPDSIFPNNWISFHEGGQVVLYPMFAENRRKERRDDILQLIGLQGMVINNVVDFTFWEEQGLFLEGTGSMVFDRINKIAYAALSERTDKFVFLQFCETFAYEPVYFRANQTIHGERLPIYHTNVMMSVADEYAVVCLDCIDNEIERKTVIDWLLKTGKEIIAISELQMHSFAGNVLQVNNKAKRFLVMSQSAFESLAEFQVRQLKSYNELIAIPIPTIEKVGGGSARCMMAEVF